MKLLFSFILIFLVNTSQTYSSEIHIFYLIENDKKIAQNIADIFSVDYSIPYALIKIKLVRACRSIDERFLELCIDESKELLEDAKSPEVIVAKMTMTDTNIDFSKILLTTTILRYPTILVFLLNFSQNCFLIPKISLTPTVSLASNIQKIHLHSFPNFFVNDDRALAI